MNCHGDALGLPRGFMRAAAVSGETSAGCMLVCEVQQGVGCGFT